MRRVVRCVLLALALSVAYTLLFPVRTGAELSIRRWWARDTTAERLSGSGDIPIIVEDSILYLGPDGNVAYRTPRVHAPAATAWGFVNAARGADQLVIQEPDGSFLSSIPGPGYPILWSDALLLVGPDDMSIAEYAPDGRLNWQTELEAPFLTAARAGGTTFVGMMSAGVVVLDPSGNRLESAPVLSAAGLIGLATAGHAESRTVAALIGDDERALVIARLDDGRIVPTLRTVIGSGPGRAVPAVFSDDGRFVILPQESLQIVNSETGAAVEVHTEFPVNVVQAGTDSLYVTLGIGDQPDPQRAFRMPHEVIHVDLSGIAPVRQRFWSHTSNLVIHAGRVYLVDDNRVLCYSLETE